MARAYEADEKIQAYYYAHPDDTPTIRELMDACNISSSSVVADIITRAASYLPGNPDQAERVLSEIR